MGLAVRLESASGRLSASEIGGAVLLHTCLGKHVEVVADVVGGVIELRPA